jgi:hypothetical protein
LLAGMNESNRHFTISSGFCSGAVSYRFRPSAREYVELCGEHPVDDNDTKRHVCSKSARDLTSVKRVPWVPRSAMRLISTLGATIPFVRRKVPRSSRTARY